MENIKQALELLHEADAVLNAGDKGLAAILMRDAISELEGSKPKELTDEEIGLWLIGLKKPDGTTLLGKLTGEELFALRDHIRDHGYLSPQPKEQIDIDRHLDVMIKCLARSTKTATDAGYDMPRDWMDVAEKRRGLAGTALSAALAIKKCLSPPPKEHGAEPVAWYLKRKGRAGWRSEVYWKRELAEEWVDDNHTLHCLCAVPSPTSREKAMEEAGDAMDELLDGPWHIYDENREKAIAVWRAAKSTK